MAQSPSLSNDPYASIGAVVDDPYASIGSDPYASIGAGKSPYTEVIAEAEAKQRRIAAATPEAIGAAAVAPEIDLAGSAPIPTGLGPSIPAGLVKPLLTNAPRIGIPLGTAMALTGVGTLPGAAIMAGAGAVGELGSQLIEKQIGERESLSPTQIGAAGLLTAAPPLRLESIASPVIRGGIRMAEGGAIGGAFPMVESGLRGELASPGDVGRGALFGAIIGAPFGAIELTRGRVLGAREAGVPTELNAMATARRELPSPTDVLPDELGAMRQAREQAAAEQIAAQQAQAQRQAVSAEAATALKVREIGERMAGKDAPDQLAILEQELKLRQGTLTPAEQRAGLEMKQLLKQQIEQQRALEKAAADQQKAAKDAQAEAQRIENESQKATVAAAQLPKSAQILAESAKPAPIANVATEIGTQTSPFAVQGKINELTAVPPAQVEAPVAASQIAGPRDASISTGTGVETPFEAKMMEGWRKDVAAETAPRSAEQRLNDAGAELPPVSGMSRAAKRAELDAAGVTTYKGKPLDEINPAELSAAVGKLRRGESMELPVPDIIDRLQSRKRLPKRPKGEVASAGPDLLFDAAHDAALDVAILGIRAGRAIGEVIEMAVAKYRALYPKATEADIARLTKDITEAHEGRTTPVTEAEQMMAGATTLEPTAGRAVADTQAASRMRQTRGAVSPQALTPLASAGAGGTIGFATTDRQPGETDEVFQGRRLKNTVLGASLGAGGAVVARSAAKAMSNRQTTRVNTLKALQQEAVGRERMPDWYLKARQSPAMVKAREGINNNRARVKDLVAGVSKDVNLPDEQNPYLAGKLFPGRVSERIRQAEETMRDIQNVIVFAAKESGTKVDDFVKRFDLWLEARHTPYYNAALRERHEGPGPYPQHRFTDEQAADILKETSADGFGAVFDDLVKEYSYVTEATRDLLVKGGIIDQTTADLWRKQYPNYVPFNRVLPEDSLEGAVEKFVGGGPGLNVLGTGVYRIKGSDLPVADIGGSIYANLLDAVRRTEKNRVDQSALAFFMGPGKGTPGVVARMPKFGERFDPNTMLAVRKQGDRYVIEFKDPKLATAFSNLNSENASGLLKLMSYPTRWFSGLVTRFNPNFLAANPIRDRQEAALKLASQGDWGGAAQMINPKKTLYSDPKTVVDWVRGADNPGAKLFQQMLDDGGMAGGFASTTRRKAEDAVKEFRTSEVNVAVGTKDKFLKMVDFLTDVSEGSTRFRAYKRALESGATRDQAALAARNVSVDFNQKGSLTPQMSALFSFFNPAVQGPINSTKALIRNPETIAAAAAAFIGTGALIDAWNSSYDPDWKKKPSFRFSRSSGMPVIYGVDEKTGEMLTFNFPVAYALRPIKATMDFFMDAASGDIDTNNLPEEMARVGGAVIDSTNPLGSGSIKTALAPTVARPVLEMLINEKFTGAPIVPKWMEADPMIADRAKRYLNSYDTNTGKMANEMSDLISGQFGVDVSPERMRYLIRQYSGGPGRAISDMINTSPKIIKAFNASPDALEIKASETPVASAFFRRVNPEVSERESPEYKQAEEYVRGVKTGEELVRQQARLLYRNYVESVPPENRMAFIQALDKAGKIPQDAAYRRTLLGMLKGDARGRDQTDDLVSSLGVESGERAKYYADRLSQMANDEEREAFLREQAQRGLLTKDVYRQLGALAGQR